MKTEEEVKVEQTETIEETGKEVETQATENKDEVKVEMISKEEAQKMVDKALAKKLPPKEKMEAFKQWEENQKTETERQAEVMKELEQLRQDKTDRERENTLLKAGIKSDDVDYVMFKVSKMDGEFEDNMMEFLKQNPKYIQKEETVAKTTGTSTKGINSSQDDGVISILKKKYPDLL